MLSPIRTLVSAHAKSLHSHSLSRSIAAKGKYLFRNQTTISEPTEVSGTGYWSGLDVNVEFRPAPPNTGVVFVRRDLAGQPRIEVTPDNCVDIPRRTCIQRGAASVEMIEHIMAGLSGLQIDNCEVWVNRAEMPAFDGSSYEIVRGLAAVDRIDQGVARPTLIVQDVIRVEQNGTSITALPNGILSDAGPADSQSSTNLNLRYELEYEARSIGKQEIELTVTPETFATELAPARTFLLESEADWLRGQGLGRSVSFQDLLVFGDQGVIENQLRFDNECVRHKALDVVGDLAVAGFDIAGTIVAHKSGHQLNGQFVRKLVQTYLALQPTRRSA